MPDIVLVKIADDLLKPATQDDQDKLGSVKFGDGIRVKYSFMRNLYFHRKYFALLNFAFDYWEPVTTWAGLPVQKNFDKFRKDIAIAAGFCDLVATIDGKGKLEARSISFASMDEEEFGKLYYKTIDVLIDYILKNYEPEYVDQTINEILRFT